MLSKIKKFKVTAMWLRTVFIHPFIPKCWMGTCGEHSRCSEKFWAKLITNQVPPWLHGTHRMRSWCCASCLGARRVQVHTLCLHTKGGWKYQTKLLASVYIWKAHQGEHRKGGITPIISVLFQVFTPNMYLCVAFVGSIVHLGKLSLT